MPRTSVVRFEVARRDFKGTALTPADGPIGQAGVSCGSTAFTPL